MKAWNYICAAHLIRCLGDRSFSFFLPLYLSKQCQTSSLRPTAALTIVQNLSVALFSTSVANLYKKKLRGRGNGENKSKKKIRDVGISFASDPFSTATILENGAVALTAVFLYMFLQQNSGMRTYDERGESSTQNYCDNPLSSSYFCIALVCGCIDVVSERENGPKVFRLCVSILPGISLQNSSFCLTNEASLFRFRIYALYFHE